MARTRNEIKQIVAARMVPDRKTASTPDEKKTNKEGNTFQSFQDAFTSFEKKLYLFW